MIRREIGPEKEHLISRESFEVSDKSKLLSQSLSRVMSMGLGPVGAESLPGGLCFPRRIALCILTFLPIRYSDISSMADLVSIRDASGKLNRMILLDQEDGFNSL